MSISKEMKKSIQKSSFIRKMFEEGARLKERYGAGNVYDFSIGNPDLPPPKAFHTAIKNILDKSANENVHGYMPNAGFLDVRKKTALKVSKEQNIVIDAESIIMTVGAAGGLNVIMKTLLDKGDQVIVPAPYFVEYGTYINNHNGEMILVETNKDFSLNIENIEKILSAKTKAILINSPHNPTGVVYSADKIKQLASLLDDFYSKTGQVVYLVADEPYREIVYDITVPPILGNYRNSLVVTSYSKTLSIPGERIGYIAVNPDASDYADIMAGLTISNRILGFVNAPALMQLAVSEILDEKVDIALYKKRRDIFLKGLTAAGIEFILPQGAFYIFCKSPLKDDIEFVNNLKEFKILAVPGSGFGAPGYFRLAYCVDEAIIEKSLPAFKAAMQKWLREPQPPP